MLQLFIERVTPKYECACNILNKDSLFKHTYSSSSRFFLPIDSVMPFVFHWITAGQVVAKGCLVIDWMTRLNCRSKLIICYVFCRHSLREAFNRWLMQYVFFTYIYIYLLRFRRKIWVIFVRYFILTQIF